MIIQCHFNKTNSSIISIAWWYYLDLPMFFLIVNILVIKLLLNCDLFCCCCFCCYFFWIYIILLLQVKIIFLSAVFLCDNCLSLSSYAVLYNRRLPLCLFRTQGRKFVWKACLKVFVCVSFSVIGHRNAYPPQRGSFRMTLGVPIPRLLSQCTVWWMWSEGKRE